MDTHVSTTIAVLLGASVATFSTLLVLYATGALSSPAQRDDTQRQPERRPDDHQNGAEREANGSLNR